MKSLRFILAFCVLFSFLPSGFAQLSEFEGHVMPLYCDKREPDKGATHTTQCALEPDCIASGFGLWTVETMTKFDKRGNELALQYFKATERESDHRVRVLGKIENGVLQVDRIMPITD